MELLVAYWARFIKTRVRKAMCPHKDFFMTFVAPSASFSFDDPIAIDPLEWSPVANSGHHKLHCRTASE